MRMTQLFGQTIRQDPAEAEVVSHQLLLRAAFIRQLGSGIFTYLPLARRTLDKIEEILRQEMDAIGGQELTMPVIHPADIWKHTGRWFEIGTEMGRFLDKAGRDMVLAMTHEEVVATLLCTEIKSYRQLPKLVYHIQTKWRDDPRPRAGLIRVREFTMKDSYSLDATSDGLDRQYKSHYQAYFNIFNRCALPTIAVRSDVGMMGGSMAHEFMYLTPVGEDSIIICDHCGYRANRQIASVMKNADTDRHQKDLEKVSTPGATTIEELADFFGVNPDRTAKAVFMMATMSKGKQDEEYFVMAIIRGDYDVNETKIANALKAKSLRAATDDEILTVGAVPGYASPIGIKGIIVIVDELIPMSHNLIAGANEEGFHFKNVNYGRDFEADIVTDIATANEGMQCVECAEPIRISRGVEVGNIFKLGTRYSESMDCTFLDQEGKTQFIIMGSYGIGTGRLMACIAEEHHDDLGLKWPISVAPFQVHIVALKGVSMEAEQIYDRLRNHNIETLYDDRDESAGVKFNDADLIGIPLRITISERSIKDDSVELHFRHDGSREMVKRADLEDHLDDAISTLEGEIARRVVKVQFAE